MRSYIDNKVSRHLIQYTANENNYDISQYIYIKFSFVDALVQVLGKFENWLLHLTTMRVIIKNECSAM